MSHTENEQINKMRKNQDRFAILICNIALLVVMILPGSGIPGSARVGFLIGLVFLDAVYAITLIRFQGNTELMKENRVYRTLYYVSWGMTGLAIALVLLGNLGFFGRGPEFAVYRTPWNAGAMKTIWGETALEESVPQITRLKEVADPEALADLLREAGTDEEQAKQVLSAYDKKCFEDYSVSCAYLSVGFVPGRLAANSDTENGQDGKKLLHINVYYEPSETKEETVNAYLLLVKTDRARADDYSGRDVSLLISRGKEL